jgi:hypothetical protein
MLFHSDIIQGLAPIEFMSLLDTKQIVVTLDNRSKSSTVLIGVNARDRPDLLPDISKCLLELKLQVHLTEAVVHDEQSISVWRCSNIVFNELDTEHISAMLNVRLYSCLPFLDTRCSCAHDHFAVSFADDPRR